MKKILVIEDDLAILPMFRSMLKEAGFKVETAENGKIGLEKIEQFGPDLILLDILMPVMNGYDVLKQMKPNEKGEHIPVIVLTSLGQETDEDMARSLGANDFIRKTDVHLGDIVNKINKFLNLR